MIIKSFELEKNKSNFSNFNLFLFYGENFGLKKNLKKIIDKKLKKGDEQIENILLYENEIIENEKNFYNYIYSGSLFSKTKIITVYEATDKILDKINSIFTKVPENVFIILFSEILEKKSKLRNFFEKEKKTICIPCYLDSEKDLQNIAEIDFKNSGIDVSKEIINLLVSKSNADRNNLKNEIDKIKSFSLDKKKIDLEDIKLLINFSGEYKSDIFINECLCGNITQYKKIISELYIGVVNQVLILRILSNKIQRLLKIKEQKSNSNNIDFLINNTKPPIFWKEKPLVKKQLSIWNIQELKKIINKINEVELLCKKNPQISKSIFFSFFSDICNKASSFS